MELKNLITFIHVAELGSFTKAADILGRYAEAAWWEERGRQLIEELKNGQQEDSDINV